MTTKTDETGAEWSVALASGTPALWRRQARARVRRWKRVVAVARWTKRALDIVFASLALLALSPLLALVALWVKCEDGGPVFFRQMRVGEGGRLFPMWKFRSMVPNADKLKDTLLAANQHAGGVTFKMKDDPRITRPGKILRKYSIDELPQFWNVLVGEMSLVGPRPPVPREVAAYQAIHLRRLRVTPGLTCLWQIGGRADIDFEGQVRLDLRYIHSETVWGNLAILLKTIPAVLLGKGSY